MTTVAIYMVNWMKIYLISELLETIYDEETVILVYH